MAGWSGVAGTHDFVVQDENNARLLAEALAAYGFALVTARPSAGKAWLVVAYDDGPYSADVAGHRTIDAVGDEAALLARRYGAYPEGGSRCDPSMLQNLKQSNTPIVVTNVGARPPVPPISMLPPPPAAPLPLVPYHFEAAPINLHGLDDIAWDDLSHAYGSADDVPALIRSLADPSGEWTDALDVLFASVLHQGTCYSATAPTMPFVARLARAGALPPNRRLDLYLWLLYAAGRQAEDLIYDAARAVVQDRQPNPGEWTEEVHTRVGEQLPDLLSRWTAEPPAVRYVLALLAAAYPIHGQQLKSEISRLALEYVGTQPGEYLKLTCALLDSNDDLALAIAKEVAAWDDDIQPAWLAAPVPIPVRVMPVLVEGGHHVLD
jgi:hypothetical protein